MAAPRPVKKKRRISTVPPIMLSTMLGLGLSMFFIREEGSLWTRWYIWPAFGFTAFYCWLLVDSTPRPWHRIVWRACQVWCAIWIGVAAFEFWGAWGTNRDGQPWSRATHFSPILTISLHLVLAACAADVLKLTKPDPVVTPAK